MSIPKPDRDPYVRVYYRIVDDPKFEHVYDDDSALATWLRLLLVADATHPAPAPIPANCKRRSLDRLAKAGIIDLLPGGRYRVHGLDAERRKRSDAGKKAADARWNGDALPPESERNADASASAMPDEPSQDEPSKAEVSNSETETSPGVAFEDDAPEHDALVWLARHGCYVREGNGHHQALIVLVERHGVARVVATFERLLQAGADEGNPGTFIFGARDALTAKPDLRKLEAQDRAADERRRNAAASARTQRLLRPLPGQDVA